MAHETGLDELRGIVRNPTAMEAYRTGTLPFPDGSILVKLAWKHVPSSEFKPAFVPGPANMNVLTDLAYPQDQQIYALWDRLADFSVGESDAALTHLLSALCTILSACIALWGVLVRLPSRKRTDPLLGWRPRMVRVLDPIPVMAASVHKQFDTLWSNSVDLSEVLSMSGDEPFRVRLLFEALPPEWFEGEHYRRPYLDVGFADSISVRIALNDDVRIRLFVFRDGQSPRFTPRDAWRLGFAMRALRWFHREQLLSHGLLIANAP